MSLGIEGFKKTKFRYPTPYPDSGIQCEKQNRQDHPDGWGRGRGETKMDGRVWPKKAKKSV